MARYNWMFRFVQQLSYGVLNSLFSLDVDGLHHIPKTGPFILASNHASHFDPPAIGSVLPREMFFFARKTLFKPGFPKWILDQLNTIPVDRDGDSDVAALRRTLKVLELQEGLVLFPEGTRTENGHLGKAKPGIGLIACKSQAVVIPTFIRGSFEALKRGTAWPELGHPIHIQFGPPLLPSAYDNRSKDKGRYTYAAETIMKAIEALSLEELA
jgi:1-acyl-sn-glycerol-3-phosphate acyltransferase